MTTRTQPRIGHRHLAPAARRRLPALALIACALSWLGAGAARADVSGPEIVGYVNAQRAANAIPAGIAQDAALSDGCAKHDAYMRLNNQVGHGEDPAKPGYTPQGNDVSSGPSVLYRGGPWSATRNPFETAPIHLHQLLAPRLDRMGAAEVQTYGCATTASRNRAAPAAFTTYSYPGDGATAWPFGQLAADQPYTPGMQVGIPAGTRTGPYLYVMFDGPTLTQSDIASATSATLTGPAGAVDVARVDNTTPGLAGYLPIGMQVIPRAPLQPNTTYTASISANVTTQGGTGPQRTLGRTWSFTTDALPDTMITAGPPSLTNSTSASVSFSSTKPGSTFLCRRDTASWQVCSNPATLTGLSDGPHTFSVRATDAGGNADPTEATRTWTVDTAPPAAVTLSASGPASPANGNLPKVSGTAETGSTVRLYGDAACAGPILASGPAAALASPGLTIAVADDSSTTLRATATDPAGNASACSSSALTYVEDSTAPVAATLSSTDPASPSNVGTPKVRGTAEAGSTVRLYADTSCIGALLASGPAAEFASSGLAVAVGQDATTSVRAIVTDAAANTAGCSSSSITYVEDSTAPALPTLSSTDPVSPANANAPKVKGVADAGSTVRLYGSAACAGAVLAAGSAAAFASPGLAIAVADDSTTALHATATDAAGNATACSSSSIGFAEVTPAPPPPPSPPPPAPPPPPRPPPPPPPPLTTPIDRTAPAATLSGSRSQRLSTTIGVSVVCSTEACRATAKGTVRVPRIGTIRARTYTLGQVVKVSGRGATAVLRPRLSAPARTAIRRALRRGATVTAQLAIVVTDSAGNARTLKRQVRLRR